MWLWLFAENDRPDRPDGPPGAGSSAWNRPKPTPKPAAKPAPKTDPGKDPETDPIEEEFDDEDSVGSEINEALRAMLPWMTSILLHMSVILLTLFVVWSVVQPEKEEKPIIPMARLSEHPGGQLTGASDMDLAASQSTRKVETQSVAGSASVQDVANLNAGGGNPGDALNLIGVSGGGNPNSGGMLAQFGTTSGNGTGLGAKFYGTGGNAHKIIYIVDASGSLIDTLPFVIKELKRSIGELSDQQQFTVIFFQDNTHLEVPPRGWKYATSDNKHKVADWISNPDNVVPHGGTNPTSAIRVAMKYQPELVFILSDNITGHGRYEVDRDELLKLVNDANPGHKIVINTIQFLYPDPLNTLADIAKQSGGIYKFVSESDLGLSK